MLINPRIGQEVYIHYRESARSLPYSGLFGSVITRSTGKPRNHLVKIRGKLVVVPCGNMFPMDHAVKLFTKQS